MLVQFNKFKKLLILQLVNMVAYKFKKIESQVVKDERVTTYAMCKKIAYIHRYYLLSFLIVSFVRLTSYLLTETVM